MSIRAFLSKIYKWALKNHEEIKKPTPVTQATLVSNKEHPSDKEKMTMMVAETCFPVGTKIVRIKNTDNLPEFAEVVGHGFRMNGCVGIEAVVYFRDITGEVYPETARSNQYLPIKKKLIDLLAKIDAAERWYLVSNHTKYHSLMTDPLYISTIFNDKPNLFGQEFIDYVESIGYYVDQE
jgi:hypothetical protein